MCMVHGRPVPKVVWHRDGSLVGSTKHLMQWDGSHRHSLTINNVDESDFGKYTCYASNRLGQTHATLKITG